MKLNKLLLGKLLLGNGFQTSLQVFNARNILKQHLKFVQDSHFDIQLGFYKLVLNSWRNQLADSI